jgi:sugar lactone lactonase YvrE
MKCPICSAEYTGDACPACQQRFRGPPGLGETRLPTSAPAAAVKPFASREAWRIETSDGCELVMPSLAVVTGNGEIWVLDSPDNFRVRRFDAAGKLLGDVLTIPIGGGPGELEDPQAACLDDNNQLYVCDAAGRVSVWVGGKFDRTIGEPGSAPGELAHPQGVAVDGEGFVHVADTFNKRVQKFSPDGLLWGEMTDLAEPVAVAVDAVGGCYVLDAGKKRLTRFSPEGKPQDHWPKDGQPADLFAGAAGVAVRPDGKAIFVLDRDRCRVRRLDASGKVTGLFDFDEAAFEGGPMALAAAGVVLPDRLNDRVLCVHFGE